MNRYYIFSLIITVVLYFLTSPIYLSGAGKPETVALKFATYILVWLILGTILKKMTSKKK